MLDAVAALLIVAGGVGAYWAYRRSLASLESLGETASKLPPLLDESERAHVQDEARPEVQALNEVAARLEAGEHLSPAEHARVAMLVRDLAELERK